MIHFGHQKYVLFALAIGLVSAMLWSQRSIMQHFVQILISSGPMVIGALLPVLGVDNWHVRTRPVLLEK